jgi:hypothetical protein
MKCLEPTRHAILKTDENIILNIYFQLKRDLYVSEAQENLYSKSTTILTTFFERLYKNNYVNVTSKQPSEGQSTKSFIFLENDHESKAH